jgi:hypothetical protein
MSTITSLAGLILERSALAVGFLAATIAVGGFLSRSQALLADAPEDELQRRAVTGGLYGVLFDLALIIVDLVVG